MKRIAILGASGYTGAELLRLLLPHPDVTITALTADRKAGSPISAIYPQFHGVSLPDLVTVDRVDWSCVDLAFMALPHATTQEVALKVPEPVRIVDISADFRLSDLDAYETWYGRPHGAPDLQKIAIYGLTEFAREEVRSARLVANPGCYPTTSQLPLVPLLEAGAIDPDEIVIDAKSGVSGAGRALKESSLFTEVSEGIHAYGVGGHRHMAELDAAFSEAAGRPVTATFTPHLIPMNRGILATAYVRTTGQRTAEDLHFLLARRFEGEPFVQVLPFGKAPQTRFVRGSNRVQIGVVSDRRPGRVIVLSALDNVVKGASGQAVQNMNLMLGLPETTGLMQTALFP